MRLRVAALLLLAVACGGDRSQRHGARLALATQVPVAASPGACPSGARIVRIDLDDAAAQPVVVSEGLDAACFPRLSHDAQRLLFAGRESAGGPLALYESRPDGSRRRALAGLPAPHGAPAVLPDGRIAFVTGEPGARSLVVAAADGSTAETITFGLDVASSPEVLRDGRLLFEARGALLTVHADGTGLELFHPTDDGAATAAREARNGDVVQCVPGGGLRIIDRRAPAAAATRLPLPAGDASFAEPLRDGLVLVAASRVAGDATGLILVDRQGHAAGGPWPDAAGWRTVDVVELAPRPRPQGHLSAVDPAAAHGELLCVDAGPPGEAATAVRARLRAGDRALGDVDLAPDGSFFVKVPADTPLRVELLDAGGNVVVASDTPFWVRPGEKRACVGCHEEPGTTPPNRRPLAVLKEPVALGLAVVAGAGQ